jgi:hypothetical protein
MTGAEGLVPADAAAQAVSWRGLRPNTATAGETEDREPTRVLRVDPQDGGAGVFRDSPVVVRLSQPVDLASLSPTTLQVEGPLGAVPGRICTSPDGECLIWTGEQLFAPESLHFVVVRGLLDLHGRSVEPHVSRFVPCDLVWSGLTT